LLSLGCSSGWYGNRSEHTERASLQCAPVQQVCRQVALLGGAVIAVSTLKGLLSSVHQQVRRQVALLGGAIPTVLALVHHTRRLVFCAALKRHVDVSLSRQRW
jgi:hypothetical protein